MNEQQRAAYMAQQNAMRRQALLQQQQQGQAPARQVRFADQEGPAPPQTSRASEPRIPSMHKLNTIKKELEEAETTNEIESLPSDRSIGVEGTLNMTHQIIQLVILGLMIVIVFMLQGQMRYFWVALVALTLMSFIGLRLYHEWMLRAVEDTENDNAAKYATIMLFGLNGLYAFTALSISIVLLWNVYTIVKRNMKIRKSQMEEPDTASDNGSEMEFNSVPEENEMVKTIEFLPPPPSDYELEREARALRREKRRRLRANRILS